MSSHLDAAFTIDVWDPVPGEPAPDGGPETAVTTMRKTWPGPDLVGSSAGFVLTTNGPGGASYVAQERLTGTLHGRAGSLVLEHRAAAGGDGSVAHQDAFVVPGSGTGGWAGVGGSGSVEHGLLHLDLVGLDPA